MDQVNCDLLKYTITVINDGNEELVAGQRDREAVVRGCCAGEVGVHSSARGEARSF